MWCRISAIDAARGPADRLSVSGRPWLWRAVDEALALAISQRHGLPQILGQVLAARGLTLDAVPAFMAPRLRDWLPDPSHLLDLDRAALRLATAIEDGEPVGIIGDYDVDGATSTALLVRYLRAFGITAEIVIPDRLGEGYGASPEAFDRLAEAGCRLCLTVDNGTTAFAALAHAAEAGQEVIVLDHHSAEPELPPALAIINPNRLDQTSPLTGLAAVGVVFIFIVAVNRELRRRAPHLPAIDPLRWLDLVALGTVCDVVPLTGLNRAFVRQGLKVLAAEALPGLAALTTQAGLSAVREGWQLGFVLGPRINAASRMGEPLLAASLLTTDDPTEAGRLAARLDELNRARQAVERAVLAQALQAVEAQVAAGDRVLVAVGTGWHAGVIGIVASRLVERFERPVFVVAVDGGIGKSSARSVPGYDIGRVVIEARRAGLLQRGGGHAMAAGMTIAAEGLPEFTRFAEAAAGTGTSPLAGTRRALELDARLAVAGVTLPLAEDLTRVAPYGPGNLEPRFAVTQARIVDLREVGDGHLACRLQGPAGPQLKAVAFRSRDTALGLALRAAQGTPLDLAGRIKLDHWRGQPGVCFEIEDATPL